MPSYPLIETPIDGLKTKTSDSQTELEQHILQLLLKWTSPELLPSTDQLPSSSSSSQLSINESKLFRTSHLEFLEQALESLPHQLTFLDTNRSWLIFWITNSLSILDHPISSSQRQRAIDSLFSFQTSNGGFGGGPGQLPHLAQTYAAILALTSLLAQADESTIQSTWSRLHRIELYQWILTLKQTDGSFLMQADGESDLRSSYCALVIATLLNFLTPELVQGVSDYVLSCQTYEGGLASRSQLLSSSSPFETLILNPPLGESHGGYNSCGLLSLFLASSPSQPHPSTPGLDYESAWRWLSLMQAQPIEGGGFKGRTNKLVDGCYTWWCGASFAVLEALIQIDDHPSSKILKHQRPSTSYDRISLQEYALLISQEDPSLPDAEGGLRDKPFTPTDVYHTHAILSGLTSAQNLQSFSLQQVSNLDQAFGLSASLLLGLQGLREDPQAASQRMKRIYTRTLAWITSEAERLVVGQAQNLLRPVHPIFSLDHRAVKRTMDHFYGQDSTSSAFNSRGVCSMS